MGGGPKKLVAGVVGAAAIAGYQAAAAAAVPAESRRLLEYSYRMMLAFVGTLTDADLARLAPKYVRADPATHIWTQALTGSFLYSRASRGPTIGTLQTDYEALQRVMTHRLLQAGWRWSTFPDPSLSTHPTVAGYLSHLAKVFNLDASEGSGPIFPIDLVYLRRWMVGACAQRHS
jgi:hypothetical protein